MHLPPDRTFSSITELLLVDIITPNLVKLSVSSNVVKMIMRNQHSDRKIRNFFHQRPQMINPYSGIPKKRFFFSED